MKTKTVKKSKPIPVSRLKNKLWELCKQITRKTYANPDGSWNCFTCGQRLDEPYKAQTGHFIPSSTCGAYLRYNLRNLRIQCYFCNINCGGNGAVFYERLVQEKGQKYVDELMRDKNKITKADVIFYLNLIEQYEKELALTSRR